MSIGQKKALSDFLNTVSAAWLTAGFIAPIFTSNFSQQEIITSIVCGLSGSFALLCGSLILVKEIES